MLWRRKKRLNHEIAPDEIFADSSNLPDFDTDSFEGRVERPLGRRALSSVGIFLSFLGILYAAQAVNLQVAQGEKFAARSENNQLDRHIVFADRGVITDRVGRIIAGNTRGEDDDFSRRDYAPYRGIAHVLGYAKSPAKDTSGFYFREESEGVGGVEEAYDAQLKGINGDQLTESDATGRTVSQSTLLPAQNGQPLQLSIDAALSQGLYDAIAERAEGSKFQGGAGVMMDVHTGEILAMVSYPEFSPETMSSGKDSSAVARLLADPKLPFLDRATDGLYAPGSIVKPVIATGALTEGVIAPETKILSTGSISLPNPYDPAHPSIFRDWRANGWVDVRYAIAYSSDVYFYEVGGGFGSQPGLGIDRIEKYLKLFGYGAPTGLFGFVESEGVIPSPEWKEKVFPGDPWRIGDTYHTAIGQYGVTVTPLQAARAVSAVANGGTLLTPTLIASSTPKGIRLPVSDSVLQIVREGMRLGVADNGTGASINVSYTTPAAKTGTAQIGTHNQYMNSWITAFYPAAHPKYAIVIVLEKAPAGTLYGSPAAARTFLDWMHVNAPQYIVK